MKRYEDEEQENVFMNWRESDRERTRGRQKEKYLSKVTPATLTPTFKGPLTVSSRTTTVLPLASWICDDVKRRHLRMRATKCYGRRRERERERKEN